MLHRSCSYFCFFGRDISASTNRVSVGLRKRDAATRTLLGEGIVSSYKANAPNFRVDLEHLYNCANIRDLVHECMFSISHVTKPQAFKVSKDPSDGVAKMQVQQRSYKDEWGVINRYIETAVHRIASGVPCILLTVTSCFSW